MQIGATFIVFQCFCDMQHTQDSHAWLRWCPEGQPFSNKHLLGSLVKLQRPDPPQTFCISAWDSIPLQCHQTLQDFLIQLSLQI
ncbi:hypothetical protein CapIbe_015887 [Capra ibex]